MKAIGLTFLLSIAAMISMAQTVAKQYFKDTTNYNFLVVDSRYQNQFTFWGRDYRQKLPLLATSLMYYTHSGVWVSASNFKFINNSVPAQVGFTLGHFKEVSSRTDWHISYSQFFVASQNVPGNRSQGYLQTTLGHDWNILFSSLQIHALINQHSDIFFTTYHSRYFEFNDYLWKKIKVSFEPRFSFTFGTHNFEYADGLVMAPGGGGVIVQTSDTNLGSKIEPLNFDFIFPLRFAVSNFFVEPSWRYTLPFNANSAYASGGLSIWTVNINYSLPIRR
jgi:hypothetical protein